MAAIVSKNGLERVIYRYIYFHFIFTILILISEQSNVLQNQGTCAERSHPLLLNMLPPSVSAKYDSCKFSPTPCAPRLHQLAPGVGVRLAYTAVCIPNHSSSCQT